jgi:hypothetical protein
VGSATLSFTTERTATLTLLGTTLSLVRQDWSGYGTNTPSALLGEWTIVAGEPTFPIYDGERITLNQLASTSSGPYAGGYRTGATNDIAVGIFDLGAFGILLDSSTLYYRFYSFTMTTLNRVEGLFWIYQKGSSLSGPGTYFVATRTKSGARVRTGVGPGVLKASAEEAPAREAADRGAFAAASRASGGGTDASARDMARRLEAELETAAR